MPRDNRPRATADPPSGVSHRVFGIGMAIALLLGFLLGSLYRADLGTAATKQEKVSTAEASAKVVDPTVENRLLEATRTAPGSKESWVSLGNLYYDGGRYSEAISAYRRSLQIDPDDVGVRTDMGTALWYSGHPKEAVEQYEASLQRNPSHPQSLHNLGIVRHEGLKDPAGAIEAWKRLLASNPNYANAASVREQIAQAEKEIRR